MGGRGASSGGGGGGGASGGLPLSAIKSTRSLISEREGKRGEVDQVLTVLRDIADQYGINVNTVVAKIDSKYSNVMGYYDNMGNLGINEKYFNSENIDKAMDSSAKSGYHPKTGSKTGLEAVTAHEMGHRLTDIAGQKNGGMTGDAISNRIVLEARKQLGYKTVDQVRSGISKYAKTNNNETIAEALSDVYCNGVRASKESKAVISELNKYF